MPPAVPIHTQTVIACIWDFDRTLTPGYSPNVVLEEYGIDVRSFWDEVAGLPGAYAAVDVKVAEDTAYLGHLITYVQHGRCPGLNNDKLRSLGARVPLAPGMPEFLAAARRIATENERFSSHGISVEHYVVSTGLRPLIEGSAVGPLLDGIWANDFIEQPLGPGYLADGVEAQSGPQIAQIGYMIDNTSKTRAVFEISKGVNRSDSLTVNTLVAEEQRRVPVANMIYIADGPSDIPVMSVLNQFGGTSIGVFTKSDPSNFADVVSIQEQGRVRQVAEADFRPGALAAEYLSNQVTRLADRIATTREQVLEQLPGPPPHRT